MSLWGSICTRDNASIYVTDPIDLAAIVIVK